MKHFSKLLAGALAISLAACSSDEPKSEGNSPEPTANGVYSSLSFKLPTSRSTDKEGEEVGREFENNVGSILVILAERDADTDPYKFVTFALNDAPITGKEQSTHTIVFQDKEILFSHAEKDVDVFAFCNPSPELVATIAGTINPATGKYENGLTPGQSFQDLICNANVDATWSKNGFLMSSVETKTVTLPTADELRKCNTPGNPFKLGTVEVVRTASRYDFRDASDNNLTYAIYNENVDPKVKVADVRLNRVALFNVRKEFYYLPRTLDPAEGNTTTTLCPGFDGMDIGGHYVITPDTRSFSDVLPESIDPLNPEACGLEWTNLSKLMGYTDAENAGVEDEDEGWGDKIPAEDKLGYRIWRYSTENAWGPGQSVTPAGTTGYVFEAEILVDEKFGNKDAEGNLSVMYVYNNRLFASADAIAEAIKTTPVSNLATAFNAAFTKGEDGKYRPIDDTTVENMGFIAYKPNSEDKYLCYYFAYNVHDDNEDPTLDGIMEYAAVRNNVYKLAVTTIKKFGTFKPDEVEKWDTYFTLSVTVRPWIVRVNNIEF